jgi:predicted Zn-dependent protease
LALYSNIPPRIRKSAAALIATLPLVTAAPSRAQEMPTIFSDTEVEQDIRTFCTPIWVAAGLNPDDVHVVLVKSSEVNAFVAGGQNVFIFTGLLEKTDNPLQIAGVVAHETGHIAGGHLARSDEGLEDASYTMLLSTILAAAAAAGSRDPGAIAGALGIGEDMGIRSLLAFSRTQEASADEAGMTYLEKAQMSPRGLLEFMQKMEVQEGAPLRGDQKFLIDHPPTPDRVQAMVQGVDRSHYADKPVPAAWIELHARLKAKLIGYLEPEFAMKKYSRADTSVAGRYGRSIALWRLGQTDKAVELIDQLIAAEPADPYFYQAKAQMLFENGQIAESIPAFKKAAELAPKNTDEIHTEYAQALLEREDDPSVLSTAVTELKIANKAEPRSPDVHRFLAIAYGRQGHEALAKVELAEEAILEGRNKDGRRMAQDAMRHLPAGSPDWLHAQDLIAASLTRGSRGGGGDSGFQGNDSGFHMSVGPSDRGFGMGPGIANRP